MKVAYLWLLIAIAAEIVATSCLKASNGFTRLVPTTISLLGYGLAFYCLSLTLKTIPVGVAYAIWSGLGIAMISIIGWLLFKQNLDWAAIFGITLIILGVIVLTVFSRA